MPIEGVAEAAVEAIGQVVLEEGAERVRRRWGWKGCLSVVLGIAGLIALAIYFLT